MGERAARILGDASLRRRLSEQVRRTVADRFTVERQVQEYLAWYAAHMGAA
jgi:hypothetical protein